MRRETNWNWASFSGHTDSGVHVGLNLAAGVNETGYTENCIWIDHQMISLQQSIFEFEKNNETDLWQIRTTDGIVNLTFQPIGAKKEHINLGLLASRFTQLYGHFSGTIKQPNGETVTINETTGMVEDHYAKW